MQWKGVSVGVIQSFVDKYLREELICDDILYDIYFTELLKPSKSDLDEDQIIRELQKDSLEYLLHKSAAICNNCFFCCGEI